MTTHTYNFAGSSTDICVYSNTCIHCGEGNDITLDFMSYLGWYNGEGLIQDLFPNLEADQRELIMTGTHPECWQAIFSK